MSWILYLGAGLVFAFIVQGAFILMDAAKMGTLHGHSRQAHHLSSAGKHEEAVRLLKATVLHAPHDPGLHADLGAALFKAGKRKEAEAAFREALSIDPELTEAHYGLGHCSLDQAPDQALEHFEKALSLSPEMAVAFDGRGLAKLALNQPAAAEKDFDVAIRLDPDSGRIRMNLGVARIALGEFETAEADLREAARLSPGMAHVHANLGTLMGIQHRYEDAVAPLRKAVELDPELIQDRIELAYVLRRLGRAQESLPVLEEAARLVPDNGDLLFRLAMLYDQLGRPRDAEAMAQRAEMLDKRLGGDRKIMKAEMFDRISVFKDMAPEDVKRLLAAGKVRELGDGQVLVAEGSPSSSMCLIESGNFEIRKKTVGDRYRVLARLSEGEIVGELSFFDRGSRTASVVAVGSGRAIEIPHTAIEAFLVEKALAGQILMKNFAHILAGRLRTLDEEQRDQITWGVVAEHS